MFFLVPIITVVLLVAFFVLLGVRARRRNHFLSRPPRLNRVAAYLGHRSGRHSHGQIDRSRQIDRSGSKAQSDSFKPS